MNASDDGLRIEVMFISVVSGRSYKSLLQGSAQFDDVPRLIFGMSHEFMPLSTSPRVPCSIYSQNFEYYLRKAQLGI